jgi:hypothetical protein
MLIEGTFALLILLAWRKVRGRKGLTKERRDIYLDALEHLEDPKALRELADGYESDGLPIEASMLRKRADLRAMPREKWENFRALCERAIQKPDANPQALDEMASAFDAMTATGTAMKLRKRAAERRMEILAFADQEDRKRQEAEAEAEKDARRDTEPPPTPDNSGVAETPKEERGGLVNPKTKPAIIPEEKPLPPILATDRTNPEHVPSAGADNARSDAP